MMRGIEIFKAIVLVLLIAISIVVFVAWLIGENGRLLRFSTWRMMKTGGTRWVFSPKFLHAYVFGRWTRQYIGLIIHGTVPRLKPKGQSRWSDRYVKARTDRFHSKVLTHENAKSIISIEQTIERKDLEQVIPYPYARDLIINGPPDVAAYECSCRHSRSDPCLPTQVCMVVGQPFVDFVLEHHPQTSRRLTQDEALELLKEEHERGHLHSAWFKDTVLNRFFAICNCCKCCCGGIEAMVKYGVPVITSSGYVARVDSELCVACGVCQDNCPFEAVGISKAASSNWVATVDWERCLGCGVCEALCPNTDIALVRDERKGEPLDVGSWRMG